MKSTLAKYTALSFLGLLLATSCTDDFEDINTNPSTYSQANFNPNYLLTTSQLGYTGSTDFAYDTWRANLIYSSTLVQGLSTVVSYWAGDKYLLNEGYTAAYWGGTTVGAYVEQVKPITDLVESTRGKDKYKNLHQVGRIMRALIMERITDLYGDVPYSEAGMGYYKGIITPKYDKQQDIYNDLLKEVEEATAALDPGADIPSGDVFYKGNIAQWQRLGNTLLLRMAMRLTKVDPEKAKAYATKVQGKTLQSNADNAYVVHDIGGARVTQNRNSQVLLGDGGQENYYVKWSKTFIDELKSTNDPRLSKVAVTQLYLTDVTKEQNAAAVSTASEQKGMPNGKDLSGRATYDISADPTFTKFTDYSSPNPGMIKRDGPTFVLTYAESELLLAEAAQRWGLGSAQEHYNAGVTAAMTYLTQYDAKLAVDPTEAANYLTAHPYEAGNGLEMINTQYWLHTNTMFDFYESWANWRRSGYPELTPVVYPNNATNGQIPRRFPYPTSEITSNPANYKAASTAVPGGDNLIGRVWWDK
ncbi:SusD/RagB family nutrient-binding outer membrane lipoprotein [Hymenobacter lutimineralis]|uniref:SusD/RagB family nutrient-binding outer membrane lipoprotein n=1 Tax=Hymenobacter lutimineralis TaxID=2606448 RepID=A0A5D6VIE1_9BACT|nr:MULTISPECIES: SusD/RagB family nutrient-binding outer membrane lipoprotein [Hymenobacter]QIX60007.1 SusD/RagB family nutrient-binding outer membrane lipoprotein [Hymenobacter sp. BT18]TYZ14559.1 SusD/RagB family nutrient-binding outer membrane lipoprotein [Hymenobacter lutimineralis]